MSKTQQDIEQTILTLCRERGMGKTICPSEVARALEPNEDKAWRALMPEIRAVSQQMAMAGRISIYRKGVPRLDHDVSGIIRLGLPCE